MQNIPTSVGTKLETEKYLYAITENDDASVSLTIYRPSLDLNQETLKQLIEELTRYVQ